MNKSYFRYIALPFILAAGVSQAMATEDTSAALQISGDVYSSTSFCSVVLSESSVSILEKTDTLINQGDSASNPTKIHISVNDECTGLVEGNKIAYKILGTASPNDVNSLANALTDESAAKGVAIGVFDGDNKPFAVNNGLLAAKLDTVIGLQMVKLNGQEAVAGNINALATVQIERL